MMTFAIIQGPYRYLLARTWANGPRATFVMLNPSTADASEDDPTIRRCIGFAKREGCGGLDVVNLLAFRSTDPQGLRLALDPYGPENPTHVRDAFRRSQGPVIAAWGSHPLARRPVDMAAWVAEIAEEEGKAMLCLGVTRDGSPRHPLYLRADAPLRPWGVQS